MMKSAILFVMLVFTTNLFAFDGTPFYSTTNFETAKLKAKEEGKLLLLKFHAKWCTPCKWMDETTFKDPVIEGLLSSNYYPVKVDIDDYEGFEMKSKFDVRFLPTILIFNMDGKMVERIEETMGTSKMRDLLKVYTSYLPQVSEVKINASPRMPEAATSGKSNYKDTVDENKSQYRLQVGVFSTFESAQAKVTLLEQTFMEPTTIVQEEKNGKLIFRVLLGNFGSINEARSFKDLLQSQHKIQGVVY